MAEEKRRLTRREVIRFYLLRIVLLLSFLALVSSALVHPDRSRS